jgi:hypothetical protein
MNENPATDVDRAAMETMKNLKLELKPVTLPDWPYNSLMPILFAEGAASFEKLALNNQLGSLKVQVKYAWPNLFREARFLSAVDFVQADRLRRKVAMEIARIFREVDLMIVPSLRDETQRNLTQRRKAQGAVAFQRFSLMRLCAFAWESFFSQGNLEHFLRKCTAWLFTRALRYKTISSVRPNQKSDD